MWAVRFSNVSKRYRRGGVGYASLRDDARRALTPWRRSAARGKLALDDVSFEVEEGASYAIIGLNGAGKSTALKLVSRISYPTGGEVALRGRVGALMEVGSGIHPELTGRENVWLYGNILGLSRASIARKFDAIVEFAELQAAIGTQVKYYSSGMQLRLGFAIASQLEPDIFVVDEALAVGDAAFQAKCVAHMTGMVRSGRTLIFVSHSLPMVREVCTSGMLLQDGKVLAEGTSRHVVDRYAELLRSGFRQSDADEGEAVVKDFRVSSPTGGQHLMTGAPVCLDVDLECREELTGAIIGVGLTDGRPGNLIAFTMLSTGESVSLPVGPNRVRLTTGPLPLLPGSYEVWMSISAAGRGRNYLEARAIGNLNITMGPAETTAQAQFSHASTFGPVYVPFEFEVSASDG